MRIMVANQGSAFSLCAFSLYAFVPVFTPPAPP
jgi:hypothetical protein